VVVLRLLVESGNDCESQTQENVKIIIACKKESVAIRDTEDGAV
jgi:hypothetical protein